MAENLAGQRLYPLTTDPRSERTPPHASLRTLRKIAGLSLDEVSARIGAHFPEMDVSRGTLSAIETGARGVSDLMLRALERAYDLDEGELTTAYAPRARNADRVA